MRRREHAPAAESDIPVHQVADVQQKLARRCRRFRRAAARCRTAAATPDDRLRSPGYRRASCPSSSSTLFEFDACPHLRFRQRHLHPAVGVDLSFAGGFDRKKNHVLEAVDDRRLDSVGLRRGHAAKGLQCEHHVTESMDRVVDVLADFEMSLAAARELVVERMRQPSQFLLRNQLVRDSAGVESSARRSSSRSRRRLSAPATSCETSSRWPAVTELPPLGVGYGRSPVGGRERARCAACIM